MGLLFKDGKLLLNNGMLAVGNPADCCCQETPPSPVGLDCPTYCLPGATPPAFDVTFAGIGDDNCAGHSAYYNSKFHFLQQALTPCQFFISNGSSDTWAGPCGLGPTHLVFTSSGYAELQINEVGGAVFLRAPHTDGASCQGPLNFVFDHKVGSPHLALLWTGATATAVGVAA